MRHKKKTQTALFILLLPWFAPIVNGQAAPNPHVEVTIKEGLISQPTNGRLFVILSPTNHPEPRFSLARIGPDAPLVMARELREFAPGAATNFLLGGTNFSQLFGESECAPRRT